MFHAPSIPAEHAPPFSVGEWFEGSAARAPFALLRPIVDYLLALPTLGRLYRAMPADGRGFWDRALDALDLTINVSDEDARRIPSSGALVAVANHPFGGADGLVLASLLARARPDVRLLGNALLARIPELRRASFFVDPFGRSSATAANAAALRAAMQWLAGGGAVAMFPAGEVSHVPSGNGVVDPEWSPSAAGSARRIDRDRAPGLSPPPPPEKQSRATARFRRACAAVRCPTGAGRSLFRYDPRLLAEIGPALELGRAFVRPEYQRDYSPLLLLWKGIGTFVARNPRYRTLFGTVSISNDYQSLSQQILARFLYATSYRPDLAARVQARNPPPFLRSGRDVPAVAGLVARTIADVGAVVAGIEADGKGVPILLRQYLKLNARLLGFNVDAAFGGVLDGLMMVDLLDVDREMLVRYMGKTGAAAFLARQTEARTEATSRRAS